MNIQISDFGDVLVSRPAGKEAFLGAKAYIFGNVASSDTFVLDFSGVKVLAPSWADEFISGIRSVFPNHIEFVHTENPSVSASLKTVLE
jgi:sugar/nucleoside kinase (ribokinase family)